MNHSCQYEGRGESRALFVVLFWSVVIGFLVLNTAIFGLEFGPAEMFGLYLFILCSFVATGIQPFFKVIAAVMLGLALAAVGLDPVTGELRMTFGTIELLRGFDHFLAFISLLLAGQILLTAEDRASWNGKMAKISRTPILLWSALLIVSLSAIFLSTERMSRLGICSFRFSWSLSLF